MKKNYQYRIAVLAFIFFFIPVVVMAEEELVLPQYTEAYKQWLELPEDEKKNVIEPQAYETEEAAEDELQTFSIQADTNEAGISLPTKYTRGYFGSIKNQGNSNACWSYSAATAFDTNYYVTNSKKKTFSNLHMDYITSSNYNANGFNRTLDSGGNMQIALTYATNGMGIALESKMPAANNRNPQTIASVPADSVVADYVQLTGKENIKKYIYNYGVVPTYTYISGGSYFSSSQLYNNTNLAYCCTNASVTRNHAVTLIGWDDNYTNSNMSGRKGAYVALNSYGNSFGNGGLYHIFYDDVFVNEDLFAVTKTKDIDYDYLYQHDTYGWTAEGGYNSGTYASNVFTKQSSGSEALTEISSYFPRTGSVTIYINAGSSDVRYSNAPTKLTTNISEIGYHTFKLSAPIVISNSQFVVGIKYPSVMSAEIPTPSGWCSTASSKAGESYISSNGTNYSDMKTLYRSYGSANACIKVHTNQYGSSASSQSTDNNQTSSKSTNVYKADLANYVFDYQYYADNNLDLYSAFGYNQAALKNHWNNYGIREGRKSSAVFDVRYYLQNNSDLKKAFGNNYVAAYEHFMNSGYAEYRKSSSIYDGNYYKKNYPDLANMNSMELIRHFALYGKKELRRASDNYDITSYLFDSSVYAALNPDVARAVGTSASQLKDHWMRYGIREGRVASLVFSGRYYLSANQDIAKSVGAKNYLAAYQHFVNYGFAEGRQGSVVFSTKYYLNNNSDLKKAFGNNYAKALNHFISTGKNELRKTSSKFYVGTYRAKNKDLRDAFQTKYALYYTHYLQFGQKEKRVCI